MKPIPNGQRDAIESALLDYHRAPGKFAVMRRQPALLFSRIREVLQLASGRSPDGQAPQPSPAMQQAACFFIRCALLYSNADHYALLGLEHHADAAAVKDRYRLMMRLMHPDFSTALSGADWPADAATRVNQAYEVLSSPVRRRGYDEQFDQRSELKPSDIETASPDLESPVARVPAARDQRPRLKRLALAFGAVGAVALLVMLQAGLNDPESLVQKAASRTAPIIAVASVSAQQELHPIAMPTLEPNTHAVVAMAAAFSPTPGAQAPQPRSAAASVVAESLPPAEQHNLPPVRTAASPQLDHLTASLATTLGDSTAAAPLAAAPTVPPPVATETAVQATTALGPPSVTLPVGPSLAPAAKPPPNPGVTLAEVHPLLSTLLQQLENGRSEQVLSLLDQDARSDPAAQALLRQYNALIGGARHVKLSNIQFKAEPREGHLLVMGHLLVQAGEPSLGSAAKQFSMQAEFASRAGTVVMTRLAQAREN